MLDEELRLPTALIAEGANRDVKASAITEQMKRDADEVLSENLGKANALLLTISGQGFEGFEAVGAVHQANILWAISDLIDEARYAERIQTAYRASPAK